jgi:hypothetical protein
MEIFDAIFIIIFISVGIAIEIICSSINKAKKELVEDLKAINENVEAINDNLRILGDKFSILERWLEEITKEE